MNLDNVSYMDILTLITKFQHDITYCYESNVMEVIDKYIIIFREKIGLDLIMVLQPVIVGELHELVYTVANDDEEEYRKVKEYLNKYRFPKRKEMISRYDSLQLCNAGNVIDSPLIDLSVYKYSIINPIKNIYENDSGNGLIIFSNKEDELSLSEKMMKIVEAITETVTLGLNKHRLNFLINKESIFIRESLNNIKSAICVFENDGKIVRINNAFSNLTGLIEKDVIGFRVMDVLKLKDHNTVTDFLTINEKKYKKFNDDSNMMYVSYEKADGTAKILKKYFSNIILGNRINHMLVLEDITNEFYKIGQIEYLGLHDALTGLYNRNYFQEYANILKKSNNYPISVVIGDINGLKLMNDIFGHEYGDEIIIEMAKILKQHCLNGEVMRVGGDEFYVFLNNADEFSARDYKDNVLRSCMEMFRTYTFVGISLGSYTMYQSGEFFDTAIRKAEAEMYYVKSVNQDNIKKESLKKFKQMYDEKFETGQEHTKRLVRMARDFSRFLGLRKSEITDLMSACELHDIGKVAISENIINKKEPYDQNEIEIMMTHCTVGYKIATLSYDTSHLARIILSHHESWNGSGFPQSLIGDQIPYLARILSILDYYDILKYGNNNKQPVDDLDEIILLMNNEKAKMFDPGLIEQFISFIRGK